MYGLPSLSSPPEYSAGADGTCGKLSILRTVREDHAHLEVPHRIGDAWLFLAELDDTARAISLLHHEHALVGQSNVQKLLNVRVIGLQRSGE